MYLKVTRLGQNPDLTTQRKLMAPLFIQCSLFILTWSFNPFDMVLHSLLTCHSWSAASHANTSRARRSIAWPRPATPASNNGIGLKKNWLLSRRQTYSKIRLKVGIFRLLLKDGHHAAYLLLQSCSISNRAVGASRAGNPPDLLRDRSVSKS